MNNSQMVLDLKAEGQDYEWYPTTKRIVDVIASDVRKAFPNGAKIMDIGAGDGSFFRLLENAIPEGTFKKYAIEKSKLLIDSLPSDVFPVGTDFHEQSLIDKKMDIIFCNPPYKEFAVWMERIVKEAHAPFIYLVVPSRWKTIPGLQKLVNERANIREDLDIDDPEISYYREKEKGRIEVLGQDSFEDSEFRKARAKVDILKIKLESCSRTGEIRNDPFDLWFKEHFSISAGEGFSIGSGREESHRERLKKAIVVGQNLIERMVELYKEDFDYLLKTYKSLELLDYSIFKELGVDLKKVKEGLKEKIRGLKDLYWKELFDNLGTITDRLTSKSREKMLGVLMAETTVDFTAANAYSVVLWGVKNANLYFDKQLLEVYCRMADKENIRLYKSNSHLIEDGWRFQREKQHHYTLDYRIITSHYSCFAPNSWQTYDYPNGLNNSVHDFLNDICTVAKNLGFPVKTTSFDFEWNGSDKKEFYYEKADEEFLFMTVRVYKKGTVHLKLDQGFMRKLNIEAGRLNGWVKSPKEAAEEMNIPIQKVKEHYGKNFRLLGSEVPLLISKEGGC